MFSFAVVSHFSINNALEEGRSEGWIGGASGFGAMMLGGGVTILFLLCGFFCSFTALILKFDFVMFRCSLPGKGCF